LGATVGAPISRSVSMARVAPDSSSSRCLQPRCPSSISSCALGSHKVGYAAQRSSHPSGSRHTRREARLPWLPSSPRKPSVPHRVHSARPALRPHNCVASSQRCSNPVWLAVRALRTLRLWRDRHRRAINSHSSSPAPKRHCRHRPMHWFNSLCWLLFAHRHPKARAASNARPSFIT